MDEETRTDVTDRVDSDYGDVLRLDCPCGHEISLNGGEESCPFCGRRYCVVRTLRVYELHDSDVVVVNAVMV